MSRFTARALSRASRGRSRAAVVCITGDVGTTNGSNVDATLVAYDRDTGVKKWGSGNALAGYSSPMLATLATLGAGLGVELLLMNGVNAATYALAEVASSDIAFGISNLAARVADRHVPDVLAPHAKRRVTPEREEEELVEMPCVTQLKH